MSRPPAHSRLRALLAAALRVRGCAFAMFAACAAAVAQQPLGTVQGCVLGPGGEPMANVEVTATPRGAAREVLASARSDGSGMFVLPRLPFAALSIFAQAPGHTLATALAELAPERTLAGVELRLYEANTLRGRVVDPEGKPVAGAYVLGTKDLAPPGIAAIETRSEDDGRFELRGVPIGDCVVRAFAPGFALREFWLSAYADADLEFPPLLRDAGTTLDIAVQGLTVDEASKARVGFHATRGTMPFWLHADLRRQALAADGSCRFGGLPEADWVVELELPGVAFLPHTARCAAGERNPQLRFVAIRGDQVAFRGRLVDAGGKALANETLLCRTRLGPSLYGSPRLRVSTGADGRFTLGAPLASGDALGLVLVGSRYVLSQGRAPGSDWFEEAEDLARFEGAADPSREQTLVATPAAMAEVTLRDAQQNPVPFQLLELQRVLSRRQLRHVAWATTDRQGVARFPAVHALDDDVVVTSVGRGGSLGSEPFRLRPGDGNRHEFIATAPGRIVGRVLGVDGEPRAGVRVRLRGFDLNLGRENSLDYPEVLSDRSGRFTFVGVAAGGHRVAIGHHVKTDGRAQSEPFEVPAGGKADVALRIQH